MTPAPDRNLLALASCMKDEGIFLLEWVAYHRAIGFDRVFVMTNDCSDGTDRMLDRLTEMGEVIHIDNPITTGHPPQIAGMARAMAHPQMAAVEWLLHIDADEYLNVSAGDGMVRDLVGRMPPCDAIALAWRPMGSGGCKLWSPGDSLLALQTATDPKIVPHIVMHKTMFRPNRFAAAIDHMPKEPLAEDVIVRNSAGVEIPNKALFKPDRARYRGIEDDQITWANACVHHYAIRALDVFLLKNMRGDGMQVQHDRYRVDSTFWRRSERNGGTDTSIQRHLPAMNAILTRYRADPILAALEAEAKHWFEARRALYLTEENRAKWNAL